MKIDIKGTIISNNDDWIYDYLGLEATCPKKINDVIENANGETLDVYINSGGGDIFAGSEIYTALRNYKGLVNIHIVGLAASAASIIACAGKSDISPTGMMMVHNVSCRASGDYHDMDKQSEVLKKANEAMANAYVEKTGMTQEEALAMMDKETWLSAQDAVEKGLVDGIAESKNLQLVASISNVLPQSVIDKIRNTVQNPSNKADSLNETEKLKLLKLKGDYVADV